MELIKYRLIKRKGEFSMKKKVVIIVLLIFIILLFLSGVIVQLKTNDSKVQKKGSNVTITYDEEKMNLQGKKAYFTKKTLMIPIQIITEELGATVEKNEEGQMIIDNWKHIITLIPGENYVFVDEKKRGVSDKIVEKEGTVYAPYDLLEKDFDLSVSLDKKNNALKLETKVEVERIMVEDQLIASIRFRGQYTEIGEYYLALKEVVGDRAIGGGFSLYYNQDYENGHDTEICLKITEEFEPTTVMVNGKEVMVSCRVLEGGEFLSVTHLGHANTFRTYLGTN